VHTLCEIIEGKLWIFKMSRCSCFLLFNHLFYVIFSIIYNLLPQKGMNIVDGTLPILGLEKRTTGPFSTAPSAFDSRGMRQSSWRV